MRTPLPSRLSRSSRLLLEGDVVLLAQLCGGKRLTASPDRHDVSDHGQAHRVRSQINLLVRQLAIHIVRSDVTVQNSFHGTRTPMNEAGTPKLPTTGERQTTKT